MARTVGIGLQDFGDVIKKNCFYVDKTLFIKEWWESEDCVTLITRPRRFGKTLNMSMLNQFFSVEYAKQREVFQGLSIWKEEKYRELQGTYPVISLSFANVKERGYDAAKNRICQLITDLYIKNNFLKDCSWMTGADREFFDSVRTDMPEVVATFAIYKMCDYLYRYYGKKVIILLDEYDTPMQEAYVGGYWNEMVGFIRSMFNSSFKTNPLLERAILTGITRISKESIFSDLNNLKVVTTTSDEYATSFGFTEEDVFAALEECGLSEKKEQVKRWYDGFIFGEHKDIYNPWSILNFLDTGKFTTYWANTSSNSLVGKLLREGNRGIKEKFEELLCEKSIRSTMDEQIVYNQLDGNESAVWSLLVASGYLKVLSYENCADIVEEKIRKMKEEHSIEGHSMEEGNSIEVTMSEDEYGCALLGTSPQYELALTNMEVRIMFQNMVHDWFREAETDYNDFIKAMLQDDLDAMNEYMNRVAFKTFSYFDTGREPSREEPERFYHGFVLGLIVDLQNRYSITSNQESGFGRYDVVLEPKNKDLDDAIILEFKVRSKRKEGSLEETVQTALRQIEEKQYAARLIEHGIPKEHIRSYGFAFEGKTVLIG